jgi:hypothetical protein
MDSELWKVRTADMRVIGEGVTRGTDIRNRPIWYEPVGS